MTEPTLDEVLKPWMETSEEDMWEHRGRYLEMGCGLPGEPLQGEARQRRIAFWKAVEEFGAENLLGDMPRFRRLYNLFVRGNARGKKRLGIAELKD